MAKQESVKTESVVAEAVAPSKKMELISIFPSLHLTLQSEKSDIIQVDGRFTRVPTQRHRRLDFEKFRCRVDSSLQDIIKGYAGYGREFIFVDDLIHRHKKDRPAFRAFIRAWKTRYMQHMAHEYDEVVWEKMLDKVLGESINDDINPVIES